MEEEHAQSINPLTLASRRNKFNIWVIIILDLKTTHIVTLIMQVGGTVPTSRGVAKEIKGHNIPRLSTTTLPEGKETEP